MTHVMQSSNFALSTVTVNNCLVEYQVEVITFDGDSETVFVEAQNEAEAMELAAELVENADIIMIQGFRA